MLAGLLASIFFTPLDRHRSPRPLTLYAAESRRLHDRRQGLESARLYMIAWGWAFAAVFGIGGLIVLSGSSGLFLSLAMRRPALVCAGLLLACLS